LEIKEYDVLVLGGGPAGYTAALYAARAGLETLVLEKFSAGGQMTQTQSIDNYPGFDEGVDGFTLGDRMKCGAERFGAKTVQTEILSVDLLSQPKRVTCDLGDFYGKTVVLATGADHKHLGVQGEKEFLGRGVAYCASCDGMLYRGKTVAVVGGGNSAASDALLLSKICKKVYLIHRRDKLRAEKAYQKPLESAKNLEFLWNRTVEGFLGEGRLSAVRTKDSVSGKEETLPVDGLFVSIGRVPQSALFQGQVELDAQGYVVAGEDTKTGLPGVFAVGDLRTKAFRQIVTAAADGAVAAHFAEISLGE